MKNCMYIFFCLFIANLISETAHAGRESHGLMSDGFVCVGNDHEGRPVSVNFVIADSAITKAVVSIYEQKVAEVSCVDRFAAEKMTQRLQRTVLCKEDAENPFQIEVYESLNQSQALIWNLNFGTKNRVLAALHCE